MRSTGSGESRLVEGNPLQDLSYFAKIFSQPMEGWEQES